MKNEPYEVIIIYYILKKKCPKVFVIILLMCLVNQIAQLNTQFEVVFMGCIYPYVHAY